MSFLGSVVGIDAAPTHSAAVVTDVYEGPEGPLFQSTKGYVATATIKNAKVEHPSLEIWLSVLKLSDEMSSSLFDVRLAFWAEFSKHIRASRKTFALAGIEDFAVNAAQGAHQIGAANGTFRQAFYDTPFRSIPIPALKSAGAGSASAEKTQVANGLARQTFPLLSTGADLLDQESEKRDSWGDVFDAATVAIILGWELWVRKTVRPHVAPEPIRRELLRVPAKKAVPAVSQELVSIRELLARHHKEASAKVRKGKR